MKSFGITDKGKIRKDNQDCFMIEKCEKQSCLIVALCDGMGGAKAGEIASKVSNKAFVDHVYARLTSRVKKEFDFRSILFEACSDANSVAYEYSTFDADYNGMGTTIVGGVLMSDGSCHIVNVGDSRAYHVSLKSGEIYQITRDHSLVEDLVEYGAITKEEAKRHPQRNVITRAVGSEEEVEADYFEFMLNPSDMLILCSDGLSNMVSDMEILRYCMDYADPELVCRALLSKTLNRGATDNVTIVAVSR